VIWDGNSIRNARAVEQLIRELNLQQNEADLYRLREQVNNYYFSILLTGRYIEIIKVLIEELDMRISDIQSGIGNGTIPQVNYDLLYAEKLKAHQSFTELSYRKEALISSLENLCGIKNIGQTELLIPSPEINKEKSLNSPDLALLELKVNQLELSIDLLKSVRMPKVFGFGQFGYGLPPGNNFFSENSDFFYSLGIGIKWKITDWNKNRNERQSLSLQQQLTYIRKEAAEETLQRALLGKAAEIESLRETSEQDENIIDLRRNITSVAASQLANGIITASEYLTELANEKQAEIDAAIRKINIARAEIEYLNISGN